MGLSLPLQRLALLRGGLVRLATRLPVERGAAAAPAALEALQRQAESSSSLSSSAAAHRARRRRCHLSRGGHADALSAAPPPPPPPPGWPSSGEVRFERVCLRYAAGCALALDGASLRVPGGALVAVCGRTGSGKSSLVAALARLVEVEAGAVFVDGVDAAALPLAALRAGFACITQDPLFFEGDVRRNLDPFGEHEDAALRAALARVGLTGAGAGGLVAGGG